MEIGLAKKKKRRKRIILSLTSFVLISSLAVVGISTIVGLILTKPKRDDINEKPDKYGLSYEEVQFNNRKDDTLLKGWWIPAQKGNQLLNSANVVIFAHGYGDNRALEQISVLKLAKRLTGENYNVLVFDFRASGESDGKYSTIGLYEKGDLLSAIDFAKQQKQADKIHLIGWSMGSVASILAGVESEDVTSIIADSPFANLREYLTTNLPKWSRLPAFPFTPTILSTMPMLLEIDPDAVSPVDEVKKLNKPLLLITSKTDQLIPYDNSQRIYDAIPNKELAEFWLTETGRHIESYVTNSKEYEEKVLNFINGKIQNER